MACQSKIVVREHSVHQQVKFTLQWTVEGILLHRYDTAMMLNAGVTMAELGMTDWVGRWRTGLQVCRVDPEHPGVDGYSLAAYLFLTDMDLESRSYTGPHTIRAGCQISVATGKTMRQIVSPTDWLSTRLSNTATSHGRHKVISHRDLFDKLEDDSITVALDVSVETRVDSFRVRSRPLNHELYRQQFCQRLTDLLHGHPDQHPADFVIRSRDGQDFPVHRFLLMAHSPVFAAMLTHDSQEKQEALCEVDDIDGEAVTVLLDYLYGCVMTKVNLDNVEKVLIMADKYAVMDLRSFCEQLLIGNLNVENAGEYVAFAEQRQMNGLIEEAKYLLATDRTPHLRAQDTQTDDIEEAKELPVVQASMQNPCNSPDMVSFLVGFLAIVVAVGLFFFARM